MNKYIVIMAFLLWSIFVSFGQINTAFCQAASLEQKQEAFTDTNDLLSKAIDNAVKDAVDKIAEERRQNGIITLAIAVLIVLGLSFLFYGIYRRRLQATR